MKVFHPVSCLQLEISFIICSFRFSQALFDLILQFFTVLSCLSIWASCAIMASPWRSEISFCKGKFFLYFFFISSIFPLLSGLKFWVIGFFLMISPSFNWLDSMNWPLFFPYYHDKSKILNQSSVLNFLHLLYALYNVAFESNKFQLTSKDSFRF